MNDRDRLAESLRATQGELKSAYQVAKKYAHYHDTMLISSMRRSTEAALDMLTDTYWNESPKTRPLNSGPRQPAVSERQEALLDAVMAPLTVMERNMLLLCVGHGASLEAAGTALGLSKDQANDLFEDMLVKVKNARRQILGAEIAKSIETPQQGGVEECDAARPGRSNQARPGAGPKAQGAARTPRPDHCPPGPDRLPADDVPKLPDGGRVAAESEGRGPRLLLRVPPAGNPAGPDERPNPPSGADGNSDADPAPVAMTGGGRAEMGYTAQEVAAAIGAAKAKMDEAGKGRLSAVIELCAPKPIEGAAKHLAYTTLNDMLSIIDVTVLRLLPEVTMQMLLDARPSQLPKANQPPAPPG